MISCDLGRRWLVCLLLQRSAKKLMKVFRSSLNFLRLLRDKLVLFLVARNLVSRIPPKLKA